MKWLQPPLFLLFFVSSYAQASHTSGINYIYDGRADTAKPKYILLKSTIALGYAVGGIICYRHLDVSLQDESQEGKTSAKSDIAQLIGPLGLGRVNTIGLGSTAILAYLIKNIKLQKTSLLWAGSILVNSVLTSDWDTQAKIKASRVA